MGVPKLSLKLRYEAAIGRLDDARAANDLRRVEAYEKVVNDLLAQLDEYREVSAIVRKTIIVDFE